MSHLWSDLTHTLSPYVPGEQPRIAGLIKLNTNECPLPPSPKALAASTPRSSIDRSRKIGRASCRERV